MKKVLVLALVAFTVNSYAQKVTNKLSFQKGQKMEIVTDSKSIISQEFMGQKMDVNLTSNIVRSLDVEDVNNNTATIEHKIKRVQYSFDAMGQSQKFDSEKEEDMKGDMGKQIEKSLKNKYTMMVDDKGSVVSVKVDDNNPNSDAQLQSDDIMSGMLAQFAEGLEVPKAGEATTFKILPKGDIAKGFNWSDTLTGMEKGTVNYAVSDINNNEVLIDYKSEGSMKKTQEAMGMEVFVDVKNITTGKITLDRKTGLLKEKTAVIEGNGTVEMAGQTMPMTTKSNIAITVKRI